MVSVHKIGGGWIWIILEASYYIFRGSMGQVCPSRYNLIQKLPICHPGWFGGHVKRNWFWFLESVSFGRVECLHLFFFNADLYYVKCFVGVN